MAGVDEWGNGRRPIQTQEQRQAWRQTLLKTTRKLVCPRQHSHLISNRTQNIVGSQHTKEIQKGPQQGRNFFSLHKHEPTQHRVKNIWQRKPHTVKNDFASLTLSLIKKGKITLPKNIYIANLAVIIPKSRKETIFFSFFHTCDVLFFTRYDPTNIPLHMERGKNSPILSLCLKRKTSIE